MIEIITGGEVLDLPNNFSIEIENSSPIYNDRGSQSIPATVPASRRNIRVLDFPTRLDTDVDPNGIERKATVVNGSYRREGLLNVTGASTADGITFNIGFDNSMAYVKWREKRLNQLENLPVYYPQDTPEGSGVETLLNELYALYQNAEPQVDELAVFPVAINLQTETKEDGELQYWEILNVVGQHGLTQPVTVKRYIDGELTDTTIPEGYCVSPFLRVWKVVELIFADLGVKPEANPFMDEIDLARLVVLNNAADAVCPGTIKYSDIMPDCTVEEFLNALWVRFGLVYNIDFERGSVKLELIRDIIGKQTQKQLDFDITGIPFISYETPQYVKLSAKTSIEGASPSTERFEDFIKGLNINRLHMGNHVSEWQMSSADGQTSWDGDIRDDWYEEDWDFDSDPEGPGYDPPETDPDDGHEDDFDPYDEYDNYSLRARSRAGEENRKEETMIAREFITAMWYKLDTTNGTVKTSSSSFFSWDPQTEGLNPLELASVDEFVPVRRVNNNDYGTGHTFNDICPTYLFGARHYHSFIKGNDEEETGSTPLAFMFAYTKDNKTFGRFTPEGSDGQKIVLDDGTSPKISLLFQFRDGLFAQFWSGYDEILRHSSRKVEVDVSMKKSDIAKLDMFTPVSLRSVRALIDKHNFTLPSKSLVPGKLTLRTIQTFGSYDIHKEQNIPAFASALRHLEWRVQSETFGASLDTPDARTAAISQFANDTGYVSHFDDGVSWFLSTSGIELKAVVRKGTIWQHDSNIVTPSIPGSKIKKNYTARLFYDVYESYLMEQDGEAFIADEPIGETYADVQYSVNLIALWVSD